jgi:hypothetical protein
MGQLRHGEAFARKLRINTSATPLLLDHGGATEGVGGGGGGGGGGGAAAAAAVSAVAFPLYAALGLRDAGSLLRVYTQTMGVATVGSAARGLLAGGLPTYDSGGSLTQLGGTFVIAPGAVGLVPVGGPGAGAGGGSGGGGGGDGGGGGGTAAAAAAPAPAPARLVWSHIDTQTGGHAPWGEVRRALEEAGEVLRARQL